ncbi:MAG TPA: 3-deoxy-manno-octulosonate cytidylyltransferase, partial [Alphaproteobacteria bacterium]|nr:3-deoxy-manno-octulosonate cytidylyltransferase [Alphaproteobacteria bacterium]
MVAKNPIILIPARLASTRLPDKPLAEIAGKPMIVQVWRRAMESGVGRVVVAAAEAQIVEAVTAAGGEAVLTDPDLPSGSDRIWAALCGLDPDGGHDSIINLQGD